MMDLRTLRSEIDKLSELVEGWNNPEYIPEIERELALEKLRGLYEAVRFADRVPGVQAPAISPVQTPEPESEPVPEQDFAAAPPQAAIPEPEMETAPAVPEPEFMPTPESVPVPEAAPAPEWVPEPEIAAVPAAEPEPEEEVLTMERTTASETKFATDSKTAKTSEPVREIYVPVSAPTLFGLDSDESETEKLRHRHKQRVIMSLYGPEPDAEPETPVKATVDADIADSGPVRNQEPARDPEPEIPAFEQHAVAAEKPADEEDEFVFEEISLTSTAVLGDVIKPEAQTLADTLASRSDVASEIRRNEQITDLRQAIGLNDKFLLIRDLFGGDGAACDEALEALNGFGDLDDCMIYIAENYAWNPNSDGAKFMMELIERKFS